MKTIGQRILAARKARGYTQASLAGMLEVARPTVAQWESGTHDPDKFRFPHLARVLGGEAEWYERGEGIAPEGLGIKPARKLTPEAARLEAEFMHEYRRLDVNDQDQIRRNVRALRLLRESERKNDSA